MNNKLSDKDKKDWESFLKNSEKIEIKDDQQNKKFNIYLEKSIDLHGYTLDNANEKIPLPTQVGNLIIKRPKHI